MIDFSVVNEFFVTCGLYKPGMNEMNKIYTPNQPHKRLRIQTHTHNRD